MSWKREPFPRLTTKTQVSTQALLPNPLGASTDPMGKATAPPPSSWSQAQPPLVNSTEICEDRQLFFFSYFLLLPLAMLSDTLRQQRVEKSLEGAVAAQLRMFFPVFHAAHGGELSKGLRTRF